jgi:hydroxyacylglutathione hydrolase
MVGQLQTNCYIVQSGQEALVVDAGDEPDRILRYLKDLKVTPKLIIATHTHFDHVLGVNGVRKATGQKFAIHKDDLSMLESMQSRVREFMGFEVPPPPKPDLYLKEGDTVSFGGETLSVIHTPGHSPGSISLSGKGFVLTGDALFNQSIGRTDLPGGDYNVLIKSIKEKLFRLDDKTIVHPGHGPETTIGDEKLTNPFVGKIAAR